jgi:hypothetical protein
VFVYQSISISIKGALQKEYIAISIGGMFFYKIKAEVLGFSYNIITDGLLL